MDRDRHRRRRGVADRSVPWNPVTDDGGDDGAPYQVTITYADGRQFEGSGQTFDEALEVLKRVAGLGDDFRPLHEPTDNN